VGDIFPIVQNGVTSQITNANLFNSVNTLNGLKLNAVGNTPNNIKIGDTNTAAAITTGQDNVAIGNSTLRDTTIGINNTGVGRGALILNVSGSAHTAVGALALALTTGTQNTGCGYNAGGSLTTGSKNVILGSYSGNQGGLDIRTASNYVVLSDGDGNPRMFFDANGIANLRSSMLEQMTISATAATGTINFDAATQSVLYYTTNASGNFTVNVRGNSGTTLNNSMVTGQSLTVAFLVTNGGTAYYQTGFQVDGSSVTPKWQGGTAPSSGNASSIDVYSYTVIKTGSATFTVLASQTKFA
jgi:hypothetical protein